MPTMRERVAERYPSLISLLNQPEIGRLLTRAVQQNWSPGVFQSKFMASRWFQSQSESQRRWWVTAHTDRGEARSQRQAYRVQLAQAAAAYGVRLTAADLKAMTEGGLSKGYEPAGPEMMYRLSRLARMGRETGPGARRTAARASQQMARAEFFYPMSKKNAAIWGDRIARGLSTPDDVRTEVADRAAKMFPHFSSGLAQGFSMADLTDGERNTIAAELEIDPDLIDFTTGRWSKVLEMRDPKTKKIRRMTHAEVLRLAREDPRHNNTLGGREAAARMTNTLLRAFGKRI